MTYRSSTIDASCKRHGRTMPPIISPRYEDDNDNDNDTSEVRACANEGEGVCPNQKGGQRGRGAGGRGTYHDSPCGASWDSCGCRWAHSAFRASGLPGQASTANPWTSCPWWRRRSTRPLRTDPIGSRGYAEKTRATSFADGGGGLVQDESSSATRGLDTNDQGWGSKFPLPAEEESETLFETMRCRCRSRAGRQGLSKATLNSLA